METWSGYVERIVYRAPDTGYTVLEVTVGGDSRHVTGQLADVEAGEFIDVTGKVVVHPLYGEQMAASGYAHRIPQDPQLIARYLGSGMIKGVGEVMASRIVKRFGEDTMRIIEEEPERLAEIKGISLKSALLIGSQAARKKDQRDALMFLQQYGISPKLALKIYTTYGEGTYRIMRENPYRLTEDVYGIGFRTADEIASRVGFSADSEYRIRSGLEYVLQEAEGNGHTCLPVTDLIAEAADILNVTPEMTEEQIEELIFERRLYMRQENGVTFAARSDIYEHESVSARMLCELNVTIPVDHDALEAKIAGFGRARRVVPEEAQYAAVTAAVKHGVSVITGGPGTGKTTTIMILLDYFESEGLDVLLAAPTGRAAKRMSEATGREASTVHRMLELSGIPDDDRDRMYFARNEDHPLEADAVIIDESSMIDIFLLRALLRAVSPGTRLVFVGDVDQLPSVGPGNVLKDIIDSGAFTVTKLTRIFRQSEDSDIVVNAHMINEGRQIDLAAKSRDFLYIDRPDPDRIISACITLLKEKLPAYVEAAPYDIQVLTPMRQGALGAVRLNRILQQFLNPAEPGKDEYRTGDRIFRVGDKVMQTKNDYQAEWVVRTRLGAPVDMGTGIFNGDMGTVTMINTFSEEMEVVFDEGRAVTFTFKQCEDLEHAFAVTVHKSQGSEYPAVILPLYSGPKMLMTRNLLYTAVTRAKSCVCIVGSKEMFASMIANVSEQKRYSGLKACIRRMNEDWDLQERLPDIDGI